MNWIFHLELILDFTNMTSPSKLQLHKQYRYIIILYINELNWEFHGWSHGDILIKIYTPVLFVEEIKTYEIQDLRDFSRYRRYKIWLNFDWKKR